MLFVNASNFEGKARDLAHKRKIPKEDATHSLIARKEKAILVSRDYDLKALSDIIKVKKPEEII